MSQAQMPAVPKGHPPGLYMMFFAELWERFCFYGMRALLALYVVQQFGKAQEEASLSYGAFTALVYATGIFGGYVADRVLGFRRSILLGGLIMALGEFMLLIPTETAFLGGLATIVVGNGLFKPNISSLVGKLYGEDDPRRDSGFTIFYMGINVGALAAPVLCAAVSHYMGTVGADGVVVPDYRWGFGMAGAGMLLGLVTFLIGGGLLKGEGGPPKDRNPMTALTVVVVGCAATVPAIFFLLSNKEVAFYLLLTLAAGVVGYLLYTGVTLGKVVRQRITALIVLLFANALFWACFEQAGNSLNFFAQNHVGNREVLGVTFLFEWFQSVNPVYIVLFGPVFAWLWVWLARRKLNPSIPTKFGLGLVQVGLGFGVILLAIDWFESRSLAMFVQLFLVYFLHTTAELCISPVGLSMVTKLAPAHITGLVMGAWFLSISMGNYVAGMFSAIAGSAVSVEGEGAPLSGYTSAFQPIFWMAIIAGVALLVLSRPLNKLMHGIK